MKGKLKQTKGITLIALIITIIVLLILAVVSIRLVMNNGILGKAEKATTDYQTAEEQEQIKLGYSAYQMSKAQGESNPELKVTEAAVTGTGPWTIKFDKTTGNVYTLSEDGKTITLQGGTSGETTGAWTDNGDGTFSKGEMKVAIGDYVKYDATKDANGKTITGEKATYTSYSMDEAKEHPERNNGRSSGYNNDQVFNLSSYTGGWRVLGVKNGQLELISADIIGPDSGGFTSGSNKYYYLKGQKGYTDGPGELNAISAMYGQGKGAESARSVTVDDINDITGYKPEKTGDGKPYGSGTKEEYNNKVTYYWDGTAKPYYEYGEGENKRSENLTGWHNSFNWYDGTNWQSSAKSTTAGTTNRIKITDLTSNFYYYYPTTLTTSDGTNIKGIAKTSKEWEVLFKNTDYWLASPYVVCGSWYACFGLRGVGNEYVRESVLFSSHDSSSGLFNGVRPVVSLKSDIQIDTNAKDGKTPSTAYEIK